MRKVREEFCKCGETRPWIEPVKDIIGKKGELWELLKVRTWNDAKDEWSDVCYAIGLLLGCMVGKPYVHVPGDEMHIAKKMKRMAEHGCIRSPRNLINGKCPSEKGE